jgi:hypothetical protein
LMMSDVMELGIRTPWLVAGVWWLVD